ncbi:alcohol dehydrogenase class IV [Neobacillus niacini]|nr:alcohol dehydrogenase class IV [Neobacillus niacini]
MEGSQFHCGTRIVMGNQVTKQISSLFSEHFPDRKRIMIVSDKRLVNLGLINRVLQDLEQAGYIPFLYDQVAQNPRDTEIMGRAMHGCLNLINIPPRI